MRRTMETLNVVQQGCSKVARYERYVRYEGYLVLVWESLLVLPLCCISGGFFVSYRTFESLMSLTTQLRCGSPRVEPQAATIESFRMLQTFVYSPHNSFVSWLAKKGVNTDVSRVKQTRVEQSKERITNALNGWHRLWRNVALHTIWYIYL